MSISLLETYLGLLTEKIILDIDIGDIVLGGKFKNKRVVVKSIGTDELGQPTINGKSLLKFRIEKTLPKDKQSKKTKEEALKESAQEAFDRYKLLKTSNMPLFEALARRAKLATKAVKAGKSVEEGVELFKKLIKKFELNQEIPVNPETKDVLEFIDVALTKPDERKQAKQYYLQVTKYLV